jgi:dipeptidyl aminopeptidase/acylaminoacyl peptidase
VHVPVAFTRVDRWILGAVFAGGAYLAFVVWVSQAVIDPPRPRISRSERPMIGVALQASKGTLTIRRASGPAKDAGLRPGDRIVAIGETRNPSLQSFAERIHEAAAGQMIHVEAKRGAPGPDEVAVMAEVKVEVRSISPADEGLPFEDLSFRNAEGLLLRGWYVPPPSGGTGRAPAIAWGHGNASDRRAWLPVALAVHEAGLAQLLFDFTGRGDSDGDVISLGAHEATDLKSALDALAARPEVDPLRLALGGRSMGAAAAILEAAGDARVRALVLDSPYADLVTVVDRAIGTYHVPAVLLRPLLLKVAGWRASYDPWKVRPIDAIGSVKAPIFLVQGDKDTIVPPTDALRLKGAAKVQVQYIPLVGLDHNSPRPDDFPERVAEFLKAKLRGQQPN